MAQADIENQVAPGRNTSRQYGLKHLRDASLPSPVWVPRLKEDLSDTYGMRFAQGVVIAGLIGSCCAGAFIGVACEFKPTLRLQTPDPGVYVLAGLVVMLNAAIVATCVSFGVPTAMKAITAASVRGVNETHRAGHIAWHGLERVAPYREANEPAGVSVKTRQDLVRLNNKNLLEVPLLPRYPREITLADNQIVDLSDAAFAELLRVRHRYNQSGVSIDLRDNRIRSIPPFLLDLHPDSQIDLRRNPIDVADIAAFEGRLTLERRKRRVPSFVLPPFPTIRPLMVEDGGFRAPALERADAHDDRVTATFNLFLKRLQNRYPEYFGALIQPDYRKLQVGIEADMEACVARHAKKKKLFRRAFERSSQPFVEIRDGASAVAARRINPYDVGASKEKCDLALRAVRLMIQYGQSSFAVRDFEPFTTGQILNGVYAYICAQPDQDTRDLGLLWLMNQLSLAQNDDGRSVARCNTRHCEEALYALQLSFSHLLDVKALCLPLEVARDIFLHHSKILVKNHPSDITRDNAGQLCFSSLLKREMRQREDIEPQHVEHFIKTFVEPCWEEFFDMAHDEEVADGVV